ncbi:MAG: acyltransferase [Gemmatimonadaceae bacterium]|nr:acyltransferase [Gemmatimonadaceae bacterium]
MSSAASHPRLMAVDVMRVLAIVAVIVIHAAPFTHGAPPERIGLTWNLATIANQLARFAVPCFFVLSGFFWAERATTPESTRAVSMAMLRRLAILFVGWSVIYVLPFDTSRILRNPPRGFVDALQFNLRWISSHKALVLVQGTETHLWFLVALAMSVVISALWLRWGRWQSLLVVGAILFTLAMLMRPYVKLPFGIPVRFNPRNGPAFGLLPFVIGIALSHRFRLPSATNWTRAGLAVFAVGLVLSWVELTWLRTSYGRTLGQDAVFSTMLTGVGAALVAIGNPSWLQWSRLAAIGPLVLGIYAIHPIVIDIVLPLLHKPRGMTADALTIPMVFLLSWAFAALLSQWRFTRPLVR